MKDYNRNIKSDMPMDQSFAPNVRSKTTQTKAKPKINAIGKKSTKKPSTNNDKEKLKSKLKIDSIEVADLEKLNEENIKNLRFRNKRNKVIIAILTAILIISIAVIVIYMVVSQLEMNCKMYIHGNAEAVYHVNGEELKEFRTPANLQGNRVLKLDIDVKINGLDTAYYNVKFNVKTYQRNRQMDNTLIYKPNFELFEENQDGSYSSVVPIRGNQIINICEGIVLDRDYENTLNVDNFKMEFNVYFEKV